MWNKLKSAAQHPAVQLIKKICGDPVQLYIILLMTSIMEYYHPAMNWLYTLLAVFISLVLMKFYDFVARHKYIGPLCYLVFLVLGIGGVKLIADYGQLQYLVGFLVWFMTPQDVLEFSIWYTIAIYLLMLGFLSSAVYYFAKVRYRMVMQFLLMLIPMSLYAKEGIQMPALLVILLLGSYFLLMVYCRQLRETPDVRRIRSFHGSMSVTAYVLSFSILAAVIPKPTIVADREYIENAMAFSSWSDILMEAISMFNDSTDNSAMMSANGRTLYYAKGTETLRLRTQTYTYYDENDAWHKDNDYDYPEYKYTTVTFRKPQDVLQVILDAAEEDSDFAAAYGLTEFTGHTLPEQTLQQLTVVNFLDGTNMIPTPTRIESLNETFHQDTMVSEHGALTPLQRTYDMLDTFHLSYYSDAYVRYEQVRKVLCSIRPESYASLLQDAMKILEKSDTESAQLLSDCLEEYHDAQEYLSYCMEQDYRSEVVDTLAAEITAGLTSDYEKAKAIEVYFTENDFVYDLTYQKAKGDNIDQFLTESKTGVCYEFATAMVLLCRSAGLPARYAQGYSMSEPVDATINGIDMNYAIKARSAHGFPEVYISGYGWVSFEPTVAGQEEMGDGTAENFYVMLWGLVLLGLSVVAVVIYLLLPTLREKYFLHKTARLQPQQAAPAIFRHMRTALRLPDSGTVMELAQHSEQFIVSADRMQFLYQQLDILLYDPQEYAVQTVRTMDAQTSQMLDSYRLWQEERKAYEREQKRIRRAEKKKMKRIK